ncbi:uncharacterized protein LOC121467663 [Drosophila elegans]|uniref:uncharacterized protein LOC121467663 n=1 Tax=Drosophila elegans TaxID=30023 RepID=UPI001BC841D3|nr:uncharacterized protein LOC121467663 [Drosophila elegans]
MDLSSPAAVLTTDTYLSISTPSLASSSLLSLPSRLTEAPVSSSPAIFRPCMVTSAKTLGSVLVPRWIASATSWRVCRLFLKRERVFRSLRLTPRIPSSCLASKILFRTSIYLFILSSAAFLAKLLHASYPDCVNIPSDILSESFLNHPDHFGLRHGLGLCRRSWRARSRSNSPPTPRNLATISSFRSSQTSGGRSRTNCQYHSAALPLTSFEPAAPQHTMTTQTKFHNYHKEGKTQHSPEPTSPRISVSSISSTSFSVSAVDHPIFPRRLGVKGARHSII